MIFVLLGLFAAGLIALAVFLNVFFALPPYLAHWFWWTAILLQLLPAYLMQVEAQLFRKSPRLSVKPWFRTVIFGPRLAFLLRHQYSIPFGLLVLVFIIFNWKAALFWLAGVLILSLLVAPLAIHHAHVISGQIAEDAKLRSLLDTGVIE